MNDQGRHPSWIRRMTTGTVCRKISGQVIWVGSLVEISFMAGKTVGIDIREVIHVMATTTVLYVVSLGQREKVVYNVLGIPTKSKRIVTEDTICCEPALCSADAAVISSTS